MTTIGTSDLSLEQKQQLVPLQTSSADEGDNRLTIVEPENGGDEKSATTERTVFALLKHLQNEVEKEVKKEDDNEKEAQEVVEPKTNGHCSKPATSVADECRECVNCGKFLLPGG